MIACQQIQNTSRSGWRTCSLVYRSSFTVNTCRYDCYATVYRAERMLLSEVSLFALSSNVSLCRDREPSTLCINAVCSKAIQVQVQDVAKQNVQVQLLPKVHQRKGKGQAITKPGVV